MCRQSAGGCYAFAENRTQVTWRDGRLQHLCWAVHKSRQTVRLLYRVVLPI